MVEKEEVFSSKMKYNGVFNFSDFYKFCFEWLTDETGVVVAEKKYTEKIKGTEKEVEIEWEGTAKLTDYFKKMVKVKFKIKALKKVDIERGGKKISTNEGEVEMDVKGTLIRDYEAKFEASPFYKFLRATYDKWIIPSTIEKMKDKVANDSNDFLSEAKAYLDLEGKK